MDHWLPRINTDLCKGCGQCVEQCPTGALALINGKAALIHPEACTYCATCEGVCPKSGIELPYLICLEGKVDETHD